ncbi:ABC transporter substrate-binding protein [Bradyrhizobium sp. i1.15.2]|uniref:ABC transporter substrate-binding protein n=1 Tax=Bradyrhizobium sp. i1.15.2 TaxID=3156362 RepID=UPI0033913E9D
MLAALVCSQLAAPAVRAEDVVRIGQIEALTGATATYGSMWAQGTRLAIEEINAEGGFKVGNKIYKLELIQADTFATGFDVNVAGRGSNWSLPEVPHGWLTPWGIKSLVARAGLVKARLLCFCLEPLTAENARELGVVDYCCDDSAALSTAVSTGEKLAAGGCGDHALLLQLSDERCRSDGLRSQSSLSLDNCRERAAQATLDKFRRR